ncbi:MAG: hypothetical protein GKC03_09915, partial [Methanomassiliicoccales archaeon]|nr:hypothetical protein [Methanomassiliicoccales archaeon]
ILAVNEFGTSAMDWPLEVLVPSDHSCLVTGVVKDKYGIPINGARVATENGAVTETDGKGQFSLVVEKGVRTFGISKQGYELDTMKVDIQDFQMDIGTITLLEEMVDNEYTFIALLGAIASFIVIALVLTWARGRE